jgi:hypothetical protein
MITSQDLIWLKKKRYDSVVAKKTFKLFNWAARKTGVELNDFTGLKSYKKILL